MACAATLPPLATATVILFAGMGVLGMGNGAVFQLVPRRFPREIGVVTGVVGAAGGLGGFLLPLALGGLKQLTASFAAGFVIFATIGLVAAMGMVRCSRRWSEAPAAAP